MAATRRRWMPNFDSDTDPSSMDEDDTLRRCKIELEEWVALNRELRQYGLSAVKIIQPSKLENIPDAVGLTPDAAESLRDILRTLMRDCDRRQELVQELIVTNNQLKEDLKQQSTMTEKYGAKAKDLKAMLETSREQIQDLENEQLNASTLQMEEEERLRSSKNAVQSKNRQLQHRCKFQEEEIERLKKKLNRMNEEDEKRLLRQNQVFQEFRRRAARSHNELDGKLLDVIDSYERQIRNLKRDVELQSPDSVNVSGHSPRQLAQSAVDSDEASPNFKALIKSYEKKIHDAQKTIKRLENNSEILKLELESRPELSDYRTAQNRIKKLEKLLKRHQIGIPGERSNTDGDDSKKYSTQVDDLEYLPLPQCQEKLKLICDEAGVKDVNHVIQVLQDQKEVMQNHPKLQQFVSDTIEIISQPGAVVPPNSVPKLQKDTGDGWSEVTLQHVCTMLQYWHQQLSKLQELQQSVNRLFVCLGVEKTLSGPASTEQLIKVIDELADQDRLIVGDKNADKPSPVVLQGIVEHFQTLFDVRTISGIYPRMNDIYTKLGEVHNVLNTLRNLLGLDEKCKSSVIVDAVGRLCHTHHMTTTNQLKQLLEVEELGSVIKKLKKYEEFVPVFQEVITKLMKILDVERMDQVIPSVRALKLLAG